MSATKTSTFAFTVVVASARQLTRTMASALWQAGCDDATPSSCGGVVRIDFNREAESLGDAAKSAIGDIHAAGFRVAQVEFPV